MCKAAVSCAGELARGGEAGIAAHMSLLQPARQQPSRCIADRLARLREQGEKERRRRPR
jgi:hypothetical protein